MIKLFFTISLFLLPVFSSNLANSDANNIKTHGKSDEYKFMEWSQELSEKINEAELNIEILRKALKGYLKLSNKNEIDIPEILSIIDFSLSANKKRLFIIDIKNQKLLFKELVAHGTKTGIEYAKYFSNKRYSNQSSLGFYVTGHTYEGRNGFSLKLHGKENAFNSNAFERGVVIHGANYVSEKFIKSNGRLGRSFGCPAVSAEKNKAIINTIKNGTCFFIFYPDKNYLKYSDFL